MVNVYDNVVSEMTQFQTIVSGFIQHIEGISGEVEKEKLKVSKLFNCNVMHLVVTAVSLYGQTFDRNEKVINE